MTPVPGLVYYPDNRPGITRRRAGRGWSYRAPDGTRIDDTTERKRLDSMAVPPAYEDVWMSPKANGHLWATGRDELERKQYRYHPEWTAHRAETKFENLARFARHLPALRRRIRDGLSADPGSHDHALAAVLALIDRASLRVGNPDYARENGSYGATTLQGRHVRLEEGAVRLSYTAKGGKKVRKTLKDRHLSRILHQVADLPGRELLTWIDPEGNPRAVTSGEVNARLADWTDGEATAKTFRTWNGSTAALEAALRAHADDSSITIKAMSEAAAEELSNTPTIARNSYIHPAVIDLTEASPQLLAALRRRESRQKGLRRAEAQLLHLLTR